MDVLTTHSPLRVGILGNSDIARRKFVPALLQSGNAVLAAFGSRHRDTTPLPAGIGSSIVMSYGELVSAPDIDLVYISLPNHLHEEWCIRALERGKHVICEKPLALSAASAARMLTVAESSGTLLYENLMYLQHPQHAAVKNIIATGRIGKILHLHIEFAIPGPAAGDFRLVPASGGGAFHDLNRYPLSAAQHFLKGTHHRVLHGNTSKHAGLIIAMAAETVTDAGELFTFEIAFRQPYRSFYEITGERGAIRVERAFTTPADMEARIAVHSDGCDQSFSVAPCDHFLATIEHACRLIQSGAWGPVHERSRRVAELAEQVLTNCTGGDV